MIFLKETRLDISSIVTISRVKVSSDLKIAKIYISVFNKNNKTLETKEYENIISNKSKLRYLLGSNLQSKYVPRISFYLDDSIKNSSKLFDIK